jgi:hypothetical protein
MYQGESVFTLSTCCDGASVLRGQWRHASPLQAQDYTGCRIRTSENSPSETVRKGILREWLGRVPSMRRAYQTDLSDEEWSYIEPHLPTPKAPGRPRVHTLRERSSKPSSTSCVVAVAGDCCPTTSHPGRPSTITSERAGSTALGRGCTPPCASACGSA